MYFSLRWKLTLLFALFATVILLGAAGAFYWFARRTIENNIAAELNATAFEKKSAITRWVAERQLDLETIAQAPSVIADISALQQSAAGPNSFYREHLISELNSRNEGGSSFLELAVIDPQTGEVLVSTQPALEGTFVPQADYFINGQTGFYQGAPGLDAAEQYPVLFTAMPVRMVEGRVLAVLRGRLNLASLQEIVSRRTGSRRTDDAYLLNLQAQFVTLPARTTRENLRALQDGSALGKGCQPGVNATLRGRDYHGQWVAVVQQWVAPLNACLFVKMDEAEAFQPLDGLARGVLAAGVGALALALLIAFLLARSLTEPINVLKAGALQLVRGDYDLQVRLKSNDELSLLAEAFNTMAMAIAAQEHTLRDYAFALEQRVDERTVALRASEALSRAVIENSPVGITVRDKTGHLIKANNAWAHIAGISIEEALAIEKEDDRLSLAERFDYLGADLDKLLALYERGGALLIPEIDTQDPDPRAAKWVSQYFYGLTDERGAVERVVALTQDISSRKERERELEALVGMSIALRTALTRVEMVPIILQEVSAALRVEAVGVVLRDAVNSNLLRSAGLGPWQTWSRNDYQPADTGIAGEVLRTGRQYVTENVQVDPRRWGNYLGDVSALALVPIIAREQSIGLVVMGAQVPFSEIQVRLLKAFADIAANALYRLMLFEQTERRLQWLTAMRSIDRAIMGSVDLKVIFNILLDKTISQLRVDAAEVLLLRRDNYLHYVAGRGFTGARSLSTTVRLGAPQAGKAALERRTLMIEDYAASQWKSPLMDEEKFQGYCAVPLIAKGEVKGVLEVFSRSVIARETEWLEFLEALAGLAAISVDNANIIESVQRSNVELAVAYDATLEGWARTLELRLGEETGHSARVTTLTVALARALNVLESDLINVQRGALLHDVGTVAIPETIWLKPGSLTLEERALIETHPAHAHEILAQIPWLQPALDIPYCHHERWNGTGYPRRLRGEAIPFAARIFAVAETWEALTHARPHRPPWTEAAALAYIRAEAGASFDPQVVEAFLRLHEK